MVIIQKGSPIIMSCSCTGLLIFVLKNIFIYYNEADFKGSSWWLADKRKPTAHLPDPPRRLLQCCCFVGSVVAFLLSSAEWKEVRSLTVEREKNKTVVVKLMTWGDTDTTEAAQPLFHSMALLHWRKCEQQDSYVCIFGNEGIDTIVSGELQMYIKKCTQKCVFCVWGVVKEIWSELWKAHIPTDGLYAFSLPPHLRLALSEVDFQKALVQTDVCLQSLCFLNADCTVISFCRDVERNGKVLVHSVFLWDDCIPLRTFSTERCTYHMLVNNVYIFILWTMWFAPLNRQFPKPWLCVLCGNLFPSL